MHITYDGRSFKISCKIYICYKTVFLYSQVILFSLIVAAVFKGVARQEMEIMAPFFVDDEIGGVDGKSDH